MTGHKSQLLSTCISSNILLFGTFTLKSGRQSPYFFQAGLFSTASLVSTLSSSYAATIASHPVLSSNFDVVFGPAYKGIPLAATTACALNTISSEKYGNIGYSFNRKEKKDHGEGGNIVGADLKGKRVLIVDDVITAGTAIREAVGVIEAAGGKVVGIVVCLDRQEVLKEVEEGQERVSAVMSVERELKVPVVPILTLEDLIGSVSGEDKEKMVEYRKRYGVKN
ncbi:orotate phosphoribosyltransferase [Ascodesmis nigricans]|uniref:Orotate phosphoribosyltransferase n=1 Tax=Ascodesmis nigricans TaxID=341454 RepID=A0A4S2N4W7_9PEZI|nr:orotate phosphoribosyltransferase [Ascodesmis nigricans]